MALRAQDLPFPVMGSLAVSEGHKRGSLGVGSNMGRATRFRHKVGDIFGKKEVSVVFLCCSDLKKKKRATWANDETRVVLGVVCTFQIGRGCIFVHVLIHRVFDIHFPLAQHSW